MGLALARGMSRTFLRAALVPIALCSLLSCDGAGDDEAPPADAEARGNESGERYPTRIETPAVLRGLVRPGPVDGQDAVIPCATCHEASLRRAELPESADGIAGPHTGLRVDHGAIACAACHHESDRSALHLADGTSLPLSDAMRLCRQCHGPQTRDYDHGSHGGMRGFWDLSRGPRERNHCVSCHDPHAPAFGEFMPMPATRDRGAASGHEGDGGHGEPAAGDEGPHD